jgi:hypothetical protein
VVNRWTARLRDPDLNLLDEVDFSEAVLVQTYNAPSTLALTGRLSNIRPLLQPGYGLLLRNSDGQQFSGRLIQATRRGNNTGTAMYVGDTIRLWDRLCYPNTNLAWDSQISDRDIVTGASEARIISLVNRNAGPAAWHSAITGTDPGENTTFTAYKTVVPDDRTKIVQTIAVDQSTGNMYMTQVSGTDLYVRRLDTNGVQLGTMKLPKGGHGDVLFLSSSTKGGKRTVYLTFRYGSKSLANDTSGTWIRLPFTNDKVWTSAAALAYKTRAPTGWSKLDRRPWCQGETIYGSYTFRLYGTPYGNSGSLVSPAIPAFIEVIQNNKVIRTVPAAQLGRDGANNPYDGRLEPEGLSVVMVAGQPCLLVNITTGSNGLYAARMYTLPLKPSPRAAEDRRVPSLRIPTNLGRGLTGTTTARSDVLGPLVASIAELADLSISIDWAYDGEPYLQFNVGETPDLSSLVRVGSAGPGSGPVVLGEDWLYTDALSTITTGLSRAGGTGSERILRSKTDALIEDLWGVRVEGFLDNSGLTDLSEIDDNITKALADAAGPSEVSAPIGSSELRWGVDIPLGARIAAVLDGQSVVDRVRQITWTVGNRSNEPSTTVQAVLGAPDAALRTPTQKQLAAMLRRLQRLDVSR